MQNIVFGASESCINCYCLILLVFIFVYLYLFGLKRGLKILFGQFWSPKNLLLPMPECDVLHDINFSALCAICYLLYDDVELLLDLQ